MNDYPMLHFLMRWGKLAADGKVIKHRLCQSRDGRPTIEHNSCLDRRLCEIVRLLPSPRPASAL